MTPAPPDERHRIPQVPARAEVIAILDFGSQFAQLIARRVREAGAFSILLAPDTPPETIRSLGCKGVILSGSPASIQEPGAPRCDRAIFDLGVPVLGICYGMQMGCWLLGCDVSQTRAREYGRARLHIEQPPGPLLASIPQVTTVWMSHGDQVMGLDEAFDRLASTETCPYAVVRHKTLPFFGVQFHPEVTHTPHGVDILRNFLYDVCHCTGTWRMTDFLEDECARVKERVGRSRIICGLSGGVDSSVVAALLARALGDQLTCIFVDNGLLRKNERALVETTFRDHFDIDLRVIDASRRLSRRPRRRDGSAGEAPANRSRVHRGVPGSGEGSFRTACAFPRPGHALSRRHRIGPRSRGHVRQHQAAPQRRRSAGGPGLRADRAVARACSRTRCGSSARSLACRPTSSGAIPSRDPGWPFAWSERSPR